MFKGLLDLGVQAQLLHKLPPKVRASSLARNSFNASEVRIQSRFIARLTELVRKREAKKGFPGIRNIEG